MELRKRNEAVSFVTKDGSTIREIIHPSNSPGKNQSLAEATLKPGQKTLEHFHKVSEEIYYVLRGAGRVTVAGGVGDVSEGDAVLIPPGTPHLIDNTGNCDLVFLCSCAPPYSHDDTIL